MTVIRGKKLEDTGILLFVDEYNPIRERKFAKKERTWKICLCCGLHLPSFIYRKHTMLGLYFLKIPNVI